MYVSYNPNPEKLVASDCVVRAIAKLLDIDWDGAYTVLAAKGYEMRDMPSSNRVWGQYLKSMGYTRHALPDTCPDCYTVKDFCRDYPQGTYLLGTGSHAVTVKNGDYYDAWDSGEETPIYYWSK